MTWPVYQDPFAPRTKGLLGYWIRCLLGTQPLRWLHQPTPAEYRHQAVNLRATVFWMLSRNMAEVEAGYGTAFPPEQTIAAWP